MWALAVLVPLAYLVIVALRTQSEFAKDPLALPSKLYLDNFIEAWNQGDIGRAFINNVIITGISVAGVVVLGSFAAYGMARWRGRGGRPMYFYFLLGLIVPFQLGLPTLFKMWAQLHLVDSLPGVILIQIGANLPLAIFLYSGLLLAVPFELEEAARIDGAGDFRTLVSVVFPLLRPVTATVVILTSITVWNDLIVSLFFLQDPENYTLSRSVIVFIGVYSSNIPVIFASATLILTPVIVVLLLLQRFFVSGLTQGALRG